MRCAQHSLSWRAGSIIQYPREALLYRDASGGLDYYQEANSMSELSPQPEPEVDRFSEGGLRAPAHYSRVRKIWWWFDFLVLVKLARLRFIAILLAVGGVLAYWDTLNAYWEWWTRPADQHAAASSDSEFWCPMHPTIVRDHPDKCPLCAMPLSKRKKSTAQADVLPAGVVSRVQLTPWRVALAGVQTAPIEYRQPVKEIRTVGFVEFDERNLSRISVRPQGRSRIEKLYVNVTGQTVQAGDPLARLYSPEVASTAQNLLNARRNKNDESEQLSRERLRLWGIADNEIEEIINTGHALTHVVIRSPISGHILRKYQVEGEYVEEGSRLYDVADLSTVWIEAQVYEDELAYLRVGMPVSATAKAFPAQTFHGKVAFIQPHLDASTRTLRVRFDMNNPGHALRPGMYATVSLQVPATQLPVFEAARRDDWRDQTTARLVTAALFNPAGMMPAAGLDSLLQATVRESMAQQGWVPAVPERAVIDTGSRTLVYRQAGPDVYEAVEVQLGPRGGDEFPIVRGLEPGDRITTAGTFLLDAETRMTAGAASTYYGASGGAHSEHRSTTSTARPSMAPDDDAKVHAERAKLSLIDRPLVDAQDRCPVIKGNRLGDMGPPIRVVIDDRPVFLCCKGCVDKALARPAATLATVDQLKKVQKEASKQHN